MYMKNTVIFLLCMLLMVKLANAQDNIQLFDLKSVSLQDSPFKHAQELNRKYILALDADRLLAPYLREAGLTPKKESYTNWENTGLDGHIAGHYLTALSLMYASTGDKAIYNRLDYMLQELKRCQDNLSTGYLGGIPGSKQLWEDVKRGKIKAGNFDLNGKWVPLYNIHKIYAGLKDAYVYANREDAKQMLIKLTDWSIDLVSNLTNQQIQELLISEHGGLNEVFADVAALSNDPKYLDLAVKFTDLKVLEPLQQQVDKLTGLHANTQISKVIGMKRIADLQHNSDWNDAARFFWETVVNNRSVVIGGNSASEHFHPSNDFSNMISNIEGPETCNTYNMLKLSSQFYQTEGAIRYIDYYEKALYNHILSSQHPEHGGLVYFTPMKPNHYRVYSQPQTSFWCCVGSGIENHSKYGEMIYAHRGKELYVNLFISSELDWEEESVFVKQISSFPNEGRTILEISPKAKTLLNLKIRYPSWLDNRSLKVLVNGKEIKIIATPGEYISIERFWKKGDVVEVSFDMDIKVEQMHDHSPYFAYEYGPIVLAAKTGVDDLNGMLADDSRGGHIAHGASTSLIEVTYLIGQEDQLNEHVEVISAKELRFRLYNDKDNTRSSYELIPFYQLHDSRYVIYWPWKESVEDKEDIGLLQQEDSLREVQAMTIDFVRCGQQQSESDHNITYENSSIGSDNGKQWRNANNGWFSYILKDTNQEAQFVAIMGLDNTMHDTFEVLIDNKLLAPISYHEEKDFLMFEIPTQHKQYQITIKSKGNKLSAKICEVRLLNGGFQKN